MWILFALLSPALYGISSVYDSLLMNKNFKNPMTVIFYASLFTVIFIPFLFLFYRLLLPPISFLPIFILLGFINVAYLYPYYRGIQSDDTSTAISFFGLGRIFIPIWAFLIIGEKLSLGEYIGVALIIIGSVLLSMKGSLKNIKFSKAIFYILLASFITSIDGVLMKYLFEHGVSVGTGVAGEIFFSFLFTLLFLLHKNTRVDIVNNFSVFKNKFHLFFAEEAANFGAFFSASFALNLAPVGLVRGIGLLTPFFILAYAKLLDRKFSNLFNEQKGTGITLKKILLFSVTALGVFLITR